MPFIEAFTFDIPKKMKGREYKMALEEKRTTRDYLYGRLLAIAEKIEETALYVGGEEQADNGCKTYATICRPTVLNLAQY